MKISECYIQYTFMKTYPKHHSKVFPFSRLFEWQDLTIPRNFHRNQCFHLYLPHYLWRVPHGLVHFPGCSPRNRCIHNLHRRYHSLQSLHNPEKYNMMGHLVLMFLDIQIVIMLKVYRIGSEQWVTYRQVIHYSINIALTTFSNFSAVTSLSWFSYRSVKRNVTP